MRKYFLFYHTDNTVYNKHILMHFEVKKFVIKHSGRYFTKVINCRDNLNFTNSINIQPVWGGSYYGVIGDSHN
jgi:hypothetical protein